MKKEAFEKKEEVSESREGSMRSYEAYRAEGGLLKKSDYDFAVLALRGAEGGVDNPVPPVSHARKNAPASQATNNAAYAGISVSEAEVGLYCALRELTPSLKADDKKEDGHAACELSDQRLLAEVLTMTGRSPEDIKKFKSFFKNIF